MIQLVNSYYRPFYKTLPRSSALVNWISVRFYETDFTRGGKDNSINTSKGGKEDSINKVLQVLPAKGRQI